MKRLLLASLILQAGLTACGDTSNPQQASDSIPVPTETEITALINNYATGKYAEHVADMQSCDDKPEEYRKQMENLFKQHATEKDKRMKSYRISRIIEEKDYHAAKVFVNIYYDEGNSEEIQIPLVYDGNKWRLR